MAQEALPDLFQNLSTYLATAESRAAYLERENAALKEEMKDLDPSGSAQHRAEVKAASEHEIGSEINKSTGRTSPQTHSLTAKWGSPESASSKTATATNANEKSMVSLLAGDLVWLRENAGRRGTVLGDRSLKTVGVQLDDRNSSGYVPSLRFGDGAFRLCSRFNYRSKVEVSKINKSIRQSTNPEVTERELNLSLAKKRMASEAVQNAELLERLVRGSPDDSSESVRYGDVVQLQHVSSGLFLAVHKTPAPLNPTCRKVSLKAGSLAAHFKILPKYKVRSIGSLVYSDDEIVFQSVKHESLYLGASDPLKEGSEDLIGDVERTELRLRGPSALNREASGEVNGAMELRSFTIKIYRRMENRGSLLTGLHWFRLFHPEENAYVQASANPDKGQVLDALGTGDDPLGATRLGGVPAHLPYLKPLAATGDASNPINLSAKAVWCFEPLDRTTCVEVQWRTMPLRIRHVPSGKYLSVDSSQPTPLAPRGPIASGSSATPTGVSKEGAEGKATFFDVALVDDADPDAEEGAFGSPSSLVFYLMPTDVTGATLRKATSAIRIEHRSKGAAGRQRILHLVAPKEPKPPMLASTGGGVFTEGVAGQEQGFGGITMNQTGVRLCFTSEFSALHVLKVQPLATDDAFNLNKLLSYVPLFKKYSYAYHAGSLKSAGGAPEHLCVAVANQCLDLIDDLRKGAPPPRRHGTNMTETLKEANSLKPAAFSLLYGGEPEPQMQKVAHEVKLLEALFEAVVAPYNFAQQALGNGQPFSADSSINSRATHKFLYVAIQRAVFGNLVAQDYFSLRSSRVWLHQDQKLRSSEVAIKAEDVHSESDENFFGSSAEKLVRSGEIVLKPRKWELWRNIVVAQGEDSLGALVTLGQLLRSSEKIVKKLVSNELLERFQTLLKQCGPEVRLINLFTSICFVEGRPSRANQEMCVRKLWMNLPDRYAFGVTFHEVDVPSEKLPVLRTIYQPDGQPSPWPRKRAPEKAPKAYLGRVEDNKYKQVCVAWTSGDGWEMGCGHLWYSPGAMGVGPVVESRDVEGVKKQIQLVPLEQLMWVMEPKRLSLPCTGKPWEPLVKKKRVFERRESRSFDTGARPVQDADELDAEARQKRFDNQLQLAIYVVAELELLTQMCKGRSNNCIAWLEKSFSFSLLMNLITNAHLPYKLIAAVMEFMQALYVDRFPQLTNSGAPSLPEKLWVYHENCTGPRRSTTPVIQKVDLEHEAAFPVFFLSPLSSASGHPDPVMSHSDHFKFFLLRSHCNDMIKSFGKAGRIIVNSQGFNDLGMSAIRGQQNLLKFGFQSTHAKLVDLCVPNGALLDGRSDLCEEGQVFDPPTARYDDKGPVTRVVTKLKKEVIDTFFDIGDLRVNFRLAQLLYNFKQKSEAWSDREGGGKSFTAQEYIMQSTPAAVDALYADFEAMFPGGSGDGAKLDIAALAAKPDLDQALVDCMMYEDGALMSAALRLLESNYGQRRKLRTALSEVTLLEHIRIPVYGDVHVLRADLSELVYLARTSTVWGVKSRVAGFFDDDKFGTIMHIIDKVLVFMHTPYEQDQVLVGPRGEDSSYCGHFAEMDLQGNSYVTDNLWSLDVADKWGPQLRSRSRLLDKRNQDILRSCNLQAIMLEAVVMDPGIAWKGSICTDREKAESERRLTMVKRALLVCCTVFCAENSRNQEIMFERLSILEDLATPRQLLDTNETDSAGLGLPRSGQGRVDSKTRTQSEVSVWPTTITELAQNLILTSLRDNASLCGNISSTLTKLFSHIANLDEDVSAAPSLDLLFILCKPESTPMLEFQRQVCTNLTAFERGQGLENLFDSLCGCLEACAAQPAQVKTIIGDIQDFSEVASFDESSGTLPLQVAPANDPILKKPERLVRLLSVVCEGGNEAAAAELKQSCGISIDAVCFAIVSHLKCSRKRAVRENNLSALVPCADKSGEFDLSPQAVLHLMSKSNGAGRSLLGLLVELVFLLPLNHEQILSGYLWKFLQQCAVPVMEALGKISNMNNDILDVCTEMVDILEHIFIFVVRLGLFRAVNESPGRESVIANVAQDVVSILDNREKAPEFIRSAFMHECEALHVEELDKEQFFGLVLQLTQLEQDKLDKVEESVAAEKTSSKSAPPITELSPKRREELDEAFDAADLDNSGSIDIYEFVQLFSKVSGIGGTNLKIRAGNRLTLRTVECADRILAIRMGNGQQLAAPIFTRKDMYGIRRKGGAKKNKGHVKLFARPTTGISKAPPLGVPHHGNNANMSMSEKFEHFQAAVQNNPRILGALQRRRFTMVTILEKGTPGPPAEHGRSLSISGEGPLGWGLKNRRRSQELMNPKTVPRMKSNKVAAIQEEEEEEEAEHAGIDYIAKNESDVAIASGEGQGALGTMDRRVQNISNGQRRALEDGNPMSGAVALTWEDISLRFVSYVTDNFWSTGSDGNTCTLIFETWHAHLIKARTWALDEDGRKLPIADIPKAASLKLCITYELNDFEMAAFHWKQSELSRMGVTKLLATVVSSRSHDLDEGSLPDTAIELFNELLNGGNEHVQHALYSHLVLVDTEGKLVEHMAKRLERAFEGLVEAQKNGRLGSNDDEKSLDITDDCNHAISSCRFLQLLCEGHHLQFQNYLRCQPMNGGEVNLIKTVCNTVVFMCDSTFVVSKFTYIELDLVAQLLNTLIDSMLGPCAGNQELIAKSDVIASLNLVIHAVNERDAHLEEENPRYMGIRGLSCLLLAACLEGREDHVTHEYLERRLERQMLDDYRTKLEDEVWVILSASKGKDRLPHPDEVERIIIAQQVLVAVSTVLTELKKRELTLGGPENDNNQAEGDNSSAGNATASLDLDLKGRLSNMSAATKQLKGAKKPSLVGLVEIAWRGKVERTCFPLPFEIEYLAAASKTAFLDEVDLSTSEKRMKALMKKTDYFVREMELIYKMAEQSKVYRFMHNYLPMVKLANYGLVFALNLNLLLSPASLQTPFTALSDDMNGSHPLSTNERLSLFLTTVLALLCAIGYGCISANLAETEVPLLIQELDQEILDSTEEAVVAINASLDAAHAAKVEKAGISGDSRTTTTTTTRIARVRATVPQINGTKTSLLADEGGPPVKRDPKAWLPLINGLLLAMLFCMLHTFNFKPNYSLYATVVLAVVVPLTFSSARSYMGPRPANRRERALAIAFDCVVRRSFLRNYLVLIMCCFLGFFVNVEYFTLKLLDVVIISPVIADIIKSVTSPGKALGLVFYLFCCTVLIFTSFGMTHFDEALQTPTYDYDEGSSGRKKCKNALSCFYLIFYHGLNEGGNLKNNLLSANPGDSYFPRIVFDSIFFVWVGIVLMNIITGLMVDTFSSIREEKQSREDILINDCFVCGTLRNTYEDYALSNVAPSFDSHLEEDHHLWTYVYYVAYLKKKDPTEDSGIESYVRSQLEYFSLEWIPSRTSFVLEAEGKTGGEAAHTSGEGGLGPARPNTADTAAADSSTVPTMIDRLITVLQSNKETRS